MTMPTNPAKCPSGLAQRHKTRAVFCRIAVLSAVLLGALTGAVVWMASPVALADVLAQHGPAVIGIPAAILLATALVAGVRAIDGDIRLTVLGTDRRGAGATLVSWLTIFAAVVIAIRALW